MQCSILFSGKNKKKYFKMSPAEHFLPRVLSVKVEVLEASHARERKNRRTGTSTARVYN